MTAADLAVVEDRVHTLDPAQPRATAVAVREGRILAVGDDATVRAYCDRHTQIIDGRGLALVPGLVDAHIHPFMGAERTQGADLTGVTTLHELHDALIAERRRCGPDAWIRGWGLTFELFSETGIHSSLIEEAVGGQPAFLGFFDGQTAVVSPAALAAAKITGPVAFEDQSAVVCRDGVPTGELQEWGAIALVQQVMPEPTDDERYGWYVDALRRMNRVGLTGLHAMDGSPAEFELLRRLEAAGDLSVRMVMPLWQKPDMTLDEMQAQLPLRGEHGHLWRGSVAKFFIDGVVESGTAWLIDPDTRGECRLPYWPDPRAYTQAVALFAGAGFQCVTHAVGDRAVRCALDAYRAAGAAPGVRHRIEHIEQLQDADLPRFAAEQVVASMQPLHMHAFRPDGSDEWGSRVGPERRVRAFRCADLRRSGAILALGSDWMVANFDPRIGMAWARLRRPGGQPERAPVLPEQALTPTETLEGYTIEAARAISEEHLSGRIRVGYRADLTAFAEDPVDLDADELPELPVLMTIVDGRVVHRTA